jgi:hypothetical protein
LLVGKPPFEVEDEAVTCAMIIWSELPTDRSGWPAHLSDEAIHFISRVRLLSSMVENVYTKQSYMLSDSLLKYLSGEQVPGFVFPRPWLEDAGSR